MGPTAIEGTRTDYNKILRQTDDEQMLLNIVRVRYRDRPYFLETTGLSTQFTFEASADLNPGLGSRRNSYGLGGKIAVEERPTVSYTPLNGKEFVERILTPISLETLILLNESGWNVERVLRTCVHRINGIINEYRYGSLAHKERGYKAFSKVTSLIRALEREDLISGAKTREGNEPVLRFRDEARTRPEFSELLQLLGLESNTTQFPMITALDGVSEDSISFVTRSLDGIIFFLSLSVDVPQEDVDANKVTIIRDNDGNIFDWGKLTNGLMEVRYSESEPENAAVSVFYRDKWFYIDDSDPDSKSTFSLLSQIFALQSGNMRGNSPVLTLPISG